MVGGVAARDLSGSRGRVCGLKAWRAVLIGLVIVLGLVFGTGARVAAAPVNVLVEGAPLQAEPAPRIVHGRVMVPLRAVGEALGAGVRWEARPDLLGCRARIEKGWKVVHLYPYRGIARTEETLSGSVGGPATLETDVPVEFVQGRMFVPLRLFAELFGYEVQWEPVSRTVTVGTSLESGEAAVGRWLGAVVTVKTEGSQATGFLVADGTPGFVQVVTCSHVLWNAGEITVTTAQMRVYRAQLWRDYGAGPDKVDLARLRMFVGDDRIQTLPRGALGDSGSVRIGDRVSVLSSPEGAAGTVTEGVISGIHQVVLGESPFRVFETTVAAEPGASGSPVFDEKGLVVGMLFAGVPESPDGQSFAIPIEYLD